MVLRSPARPASTAASRIAVVKSACPADIVADLARRIDKRFHAIDALRARDGAAAVAQALAPGDRFIPTASSLNLEAVLAGEAIARMLVGSILPALAQRILGAALVLDLDRAWVRRQYAPGRYPPLHAPHGWHQDGALGFDFVTLGSDAAPRDALLTMLTCWIPLTPCGLHAPGIELITPSPAGLVPFADLSPSRLRELHPADAFLRPVLAPGDALLLPANVLHRTHVTPDMSLNRTSIELRFFPADTIPSRLSSDRFMRLADRAFPCR